MRLPIIALLVACLTGCATEPDAIPTAASAELPETPAAITVEEVRGDALAAAVAKHKDKVVVVDLWATWCESCVKRFPHIVEMQKKYADQGLVCISVSMDKLTPTTYKKDAVLAFLKKKDAAFPNYVVAEPEKDEAELTKLLTDEYRSIPLLVIFDKAGRRVWTSADAPLTDAQLDKKVEDLLAK
jgi:thiol-disulfide isomerase/thioredoxin